MARRYYGIENLNLDASQKQTLVAALRNLGRAKTRNPAFYNHWRTRLDNDAVIFEANWNIDDWTIANVKVYLGNVFDIDPTTIDHATQQTQYGPMVTFSRGGGPTKDKIRTIAFGGVSSTYAESHAAALEYLADNRDEWEESV